MSQASVGPIEAIAHLLQLTELFEPLEDVQFWIKDCEGRYCRFNRAFLLNYGLSEPGQALGKTDYDLSPAFIADQFRFDDEQVLKGHRVVNRIEQVGHADHTASWCVTNKVPICDPGGRIVGTAGTTRSLGAEGRELIGAHGFERVVAHIRDHYPEHVTNRQLAAVAHLSVRTFERKFHDSFHVTPQQYVRKLRVRMACRGLVFTEKPLAEVAFECGFADQSHLGREFRRETGLSPRAYRARYRPAGR